MLQGLLDQFEIAGSRLALDLASRLAGYIGGRLEALIKRRGLEHHWSTLNMEFGGMNDVLWRLAAISGEARHRRWASLFDKPCFLAPLGLHGHDELTRMHGNTHGVPDRGSSPRLADEHLLICS